MEETWKRVYKKILNYNNLAERWNRIATQRGLRTVRSFQERTGIPFTASVKTKKLL